MLISTITSNIPFIQLSLMHRITEKICKERWQHWCTKISGVKVLPTLLISTITSNMSFIQLSLMLSGYPASSFFKLRAAGDATRHFDVVTDRGDTDPVKNGDAFEILGIMTILADRKVTVKGSDNLS